MDDNVTVFMISTVNSSTITGLPDDTQVNIIVFGILTNQNIFSFDFTSVRTLDIKGMCKFIIKSCQLHY